MTYKKCLYEYSKPSQDYMQAIKHNLKIWLKTGKNLVKNWLSAAVHCGFGREASTINDDKKIVKNCFKAAGHCGFGRADSNINYSTRNVNTNILNLLKIILKP